MLKLFFFLFITFNVEIPIDPVEPKIAIFFFFFYIIWNNFKKPAATITKIIPSILSKIPPCPGKISPVSLILFFLLK